MVSWSHKYKFISMNNELISKNKHFLITALLVFAIGAGVFGYLRYKNSITPAPVIPISATSTPPPEVWQTYTNSQLGFSIKYPRMVTGIYRCSPYKDFWVPIKVFEDNASGITYITQEYYYEAPFNEKLNDYTEPCNKNIYTLAILQGEIEKQQDKGEESYVYGSGWFKTLIGWTISVRDMKNENELNKFVKENYGSGCFVENKKPWKQDEVYEIEIKGEDWDKGADLGSTTCVWSSVKVLLYASQKNKIMSVNLGQECTFQNNPTAKPYVCADDRMIDSFRFE